MEGLWLMIDVGRDRGRIMVDVGAAGGERLSKNNG